MRCYAEYCRLAEVGVNIRKKAAEVWSKRCRGWQGHWLHSYQKGSSVAVECASRAVLHQKFELRTSSREPNRTDEAWGNEIPPRRWGSLAVQPRGVPGGIIKPLWRVRAGCCVRQYRLVSTHLDSLHVRKIPRRDGPPNSGFGVSGVD